jgi:ATP-dependent DNA helicase RecG
MRCSCLAEMGARAPSKKRSASKKPKPSGEANTLKGKLARLGLARRMDLALHLPLRYEDETRITPVNALVDGVFAQVEGVVQRCEVQYRPRRVLVVRLADDSGVLVLRFLNFYGSQQKTMSEGTRLRVCGEPRDGFFGIEMIHPRFKAVSEGAPLPSSLTPVYPTTAGLGQGVLRKAIVNALAAARAAGELTDTLDAAHRTRVQLPSFADALDALHFPTPQVDASTLVKRSHPAWQRMKFDELLAQQLSLKRAYRSRATHRAPVLVHAPRRPSGGHLERPMPEDALWQAFSKALPFALTAAQLRVCSEIEADLARPHPMRRLLQGDVGSGKTIVAALAACRAIDVGWQAAFMAPTEILAEQHMRKLSGWLAPLGVRIVWLTGSLKKKEKEAAAAQIASGEAQLAIGTHALFQDGVQFAKLGLAIIDEQHRFGVLQRLSLTQKGEDGSFRPHQLMMSATPIPRTLAMTFYADLDVSTIDELPPGRTPIRTRLVADARRDEVIARIRDACAEGRQVYWVCPLIEESEALQLETAVETHARLTQVLTDLNVGLVHGRLKAQEKARVMEGFIANQVQVLVATTVIEVGVDVPNATLMVIENAERFGLAQLHQLRGRVGRGAHSSTCILLYSGPLGETARARLKVMFESTDGFEIAREDLRLRGPGEFLGRAQSGVPMLKFAHLEEDTHLVAAAQTLAEELLDQDTARADAHLERWLGSREAMLGV